MCQDKRHEKLTQVTDERKNGKLEDLPEKPLTAEKEAAVKGGSGGKTTLSDVLITGY